MKDWSFAGMTDTGRVRVHNEDSFRLDKELGVVVLADGVGGQKAGEVASQLATDLTCERLAENLATNDNGHIDTTTGLHNESLQLLDAIYYANEAILTAANTESSFAGMATTLVAALFFADRIAVSHLGDSRLYRFRQSVGLEQLTEDHCFLQEQVRSGFITQKQAEQITGMNYITRALGSQYDIEPELNEYEVQPGDLYLLCSDGLCGVVPDQIISEVIDDNRDSLEKACKQLVDLANGNGGPDNISVVLVKCGEAFQRAARNASSAA